MLKENNIEVVFGKMNVLCFRQRQTRVCKTTVAASTRVSVRITGQCVSAMRDISSPLTEDHAKVIPLSHCV